MFILSSSRAKVNKSGSARYKALDKWNNQLNNLQKLVINKMA